MNEGKIKQTNIDKTMTNRSKQTTEQNKLDRQNIEWRIETNKRNIQHT